MSLGGGPDPSLPLRANLETSISVPRRCRCLYTAPLPEQEIRIKNWHDRFMDSRFHETTAPTQPQLPFQLSATTQATRPMAAPRSAMPPPFRSAPCDGGNLPHLHWPAPLFSLRFSLVSANSPVPISTVVLRHVEPPTSILRLLLLLLLDVGCWAVVVTLPIT